MTLWVNVFEWFERLLEGSVRRRGEVTLGQGELWRCWTFGGVISLRRHLGRELAKALRRP
jgi:hypothetical protein